MLSFPSQQLFEMAQLLLFLVVSTLAIVNGQTYKTLQCPIPGGQSTMNEEECLRYTACIWEPASNTCYMRNQLDIGYLTATAPQDTGRGFTVELSLIDNDFSMYDGEIQNLIFEAIYHEEYHVQIKIYDRDNARYEVPIPLNLPYEADESRLYEVTVSDVGQPFSFTVARTSGTVLFNLIGALTFEDQFIQFTTELASTYVYGFGESTHQQFRRVFDPRESYAIFAKDIPIALTPDTAEYGHHPYYMVIEDDEGNSHSALYYGSNAMEYSTFYLDEEKTIPALTLRTIGGIIDMHFFLGPMPEDTTVQYLKAIGNPIFPPYYFLGFQLCRWGYESTDHIREVRERMKQYGIPQDLQVFDIDYMDHYRDFTVDPENFSDLDVLVQELHDDGLRVTTILDPAIVVDIDNYEPYVRGVEADAFIKWMDEIYIPDDQAWYMFDYIVAYCWPDNKTVYPDFFKPETTDWWANEIRILKEDLFDFDVMWIDMNEPAAFGTDTDRPWNYPEGAADWSLKCPYNHLDSPPYPTSVSYQPGQESYRISDHSICMSTNQTDGTSVWQHYDVHSLYGHSHLVATYQAMEELFPEKRNAILVRSTFPGMGKMGAHWLGDNSATWQHMQMSIWGMFEFNMFGMPYTGADICGFIGETTEELCMRWTQLGAFYPFSRNHNADDYPDQDPGMWESVGNVAREILLFRYKYNPYLYSLFYRAHVDGSTVVRPLLTNWPTDLIARDVDDQFMWGDGMMIAPILYEDHISRDVYFPEAYWYDMFTGELITSTSASLDVSIPLEDIAVYVRGGKILPFQEPAINTIESRLNPFGLLVAIDGATGSASGEIYWDDGESKYSEATSYLSTLTYDQGTLNMVVNRSSTTVEALNIETITLFGFPSDPTSISINGENADTSQWSYDATLMVLQLTLASPLGQNLAVEFST